MQVLVTPRAEKNFDTIINYLKIKWGEQSVKKFIAQTDSTLRLLKNFPTIGTKETENIRGLQMSKQTKILYRLTNENIIILAFFDVRQSPDKKFT